MDWDPFSHRHPAKFRQQIHPKEQTLAEQLRSVEQLLVQTQASDDRLSKMERTQNDILKAVEQMSRVLDSVGLKTID